MKVVHFYPIWLSQTATWLYYQCKYLPDSVQPHIVCERTANLEQFDISNIHCLADQPRLYSVWDRGLRKLKIRTYLGFMKRVIRKVDADVVHCHFGPLACDNLPAARRTRSRKVVTFYGLDVKQMPQNDPGLLPRYRKLFRDVDAVFCEGPFMAEEIRQLGCPSEKVKVHHLGVPLEDLPYQPRELQPGEPLKVLIASTFTEKKGIPYGIEAIAELSKTLPVELTIIGDNPAGSTRGVQEKARILELLQKYDLMKSTKLMGYVSHPEMIRTAYQHHVFLSPSVTARNGDTEGGAPVAIIEMAASGMPIVSTRHCDIPNVVIDGKTGWLSDERDVAGLVLHLRWWAENPSKWEPMLKAGRKRVEEHFDCVRQGERLAELYHSLI